jgi:DNA polymerase I-like protein with 3'-5' exonuclease and polymerase domains
MEELSSLVRSAIKAPDGHTFVDVDFSSIENRVASWIAGQNDKVELFRQGLDE